jgi:hypothetical protein
MELGERVNDLEKIIDHLLKLTNRMADAMNTMQNRLLALQDVLERKRLVVDGEVMTKMQEFAEIELAVECEEFRPALRLIREADQGPDAQEQP